VLFFELFPLFMLIASAVVFVILIVRHHSDGQD
jgi:hypothetical protein